MSVDAVDLVRTFGFRFAGGREEASAYLVKGREW